MSHEYFKFGIFHQLLKVTFLVTLFDRKIKVFKNSPNYYIFGILKLTFVHSN